MAEQNCFGEDRPLRVAVIGSGPSGVYATEALIKQGEVPVRVDVFDRLPTPFGLVRYGVAPDHQTIKSVTKVMQKVLQDPKVRFFGNVAFGRDLTHDDLRRHYDAVIYTVGASSDRHLGIPGEDLPGSLSATEFVAWYNGHPDYKDLPIRLDARGVAVVGVGNVAVDVTRILAKSVEELGRTDIADHALPVLAESQVTDIYMLGRRGPAQAKFTTKELRELGSCSMQMWWCAPRSWSLTRGVQPPSPTSRVCSRTWKCYGSSPRGPFRKAPPGAHSLPGVAGGHPGPGPGGADLPGEESAGRGLECGGYRGV